jgi:hypothetical protein
MELKVVCGCGQKYKFDVEPVNQRMPFPVNCPVCNLEGTGLANTMLAQMPPPAPGYMPAPVPVQMAPPPAPVPAPTAGLKLNREAAPSPVAAAPPMPMPIPATAGRPMPAVGALPKYMQPNKTAQQNSFPLGVVGAFIGAVVAVVLMVGFTEFTHLKFPLMGTVMGAIIGFGARLMYRGTDSNLGAMAAAVSLISVGSTLFFLFGTNGMISSLVSVIFAVMFAFKASS